MITDISRQQKCTNPRFTIRFAKYVHIRTAPVNGHGMLHFLTTVTSINAQVEEMKDTYGAISRCIIIPKPKRKIPHDRYTPEEGKTILH